MRFLFTFVGGRGHFDPLAPVARAAVLRGHTVAVAGAGAHLPTVERAGFTALATSEARPQTARVREPLPPVDPARDDWEIRELFARRAGRERAGKLLEIIRDWQPDLVIRDEVDFGAAIAAEKAGLPCVTVLVLAAGTLVRKDLVVEPLHELRAEHGLPEDRGLTMLDGQLVLAPFPPSLRDPGAPLPPGAFSFRQGDPIPPRTPHEPPGVYFTLGTDFNTASGDLFERTLAGLGRLAARVTTTVGTQLDPAGFGEQPDHVRVERFVPQAELLPSIDLVVSHSGSGSVLGALSHGLPSLVFPMGADQPGNARQLARLGAGVALDPETATPEEIHDTAVRLLTESRWREAAQRVQEEINTQPGAEQTVPLLEITATSAPGSPRPAP
ncbi:glycosyltransferase [Amycolatopsis rhabdoformis]|uniref:Glycosyltransferase n=1 Tax=Amycolatopsis rhabdoformis TaxID=1448059 RepID=A0ABZ1I3A8_9PSEU|nr:glycosyltransferase [Amycolatopsis rhabdoformis]WSE28876.1 glycosyltransferase [Amycolatopsis rhabdoformis]